MDTVALIIVFIAIYCVGYIVGHDAGLKHRISQDQLDKWGEL
jgi:hypothetical protein